MTLNSIIAIIKQYHKTGLLILLIIATVTIILFTNVKVNVSSNGTEIEWESSPSILLR